VVHVKQEVWYEREVTGNESYSERHDIFEGVLRVKSGGSLTLVNVTFNVADNGNIIVEPGGLMNITDKDGDPSTGDGCLINSSKADFIFRVEAEAAFHAANSRFEWSHDFSLQVLSDEAHIANSSFSSGRIELYLEGDGCTVLGNVFGCDYCSLASKGDNKRIVGSTIANGVILVDGGSGNVVEENTVTNNEPRGHGLIFFFSQNTMARGNNVSSCYYGLMAISSSVTVEKCVFSDCKYGLLVAYSRVDAQSCSFTNNT